MAKRKDVQKIDTDLIRHFMLGGTSDKDAQSFSKKKIRCKG